MCVWKFKEEKTCEDYRCRVGGKVEEAKWKGLGVNDHWQQMNGIVMETAQDMWNDKGSTQTQGNVVME